MFEMKGRYNGAEIMIDEIDPVTRRQIQGFLDHPAFAGTRIAIMPDCHAGKGAVIGLTMHSNDFVIPNVIGVDIGCGMLSARFPGGASDPGSFDAAGLDRFIKARIPSGFSINADCRHAAEGSLVRDVRTACSMIGIDGDKALRAVGSLGGGNHFIEAGFDARGRLYLTIHSGSRNFGKCVADFYQKKARDMQGKLPFKGLPRDLAWLPASSREAEDYLFCLGAAQRFARRNRLEMMDRISGFLGREPADIVESVHNYIDPEDGIIRKGATPARKGQRVIIPFNMRDGIALCVGKGNPRYNQSAPHGAGRVLSRTQARKTLSLEEFRRQMSGIYTTTAVASTLDEAPDAYKDMRTILANISETVEVVDFIKPVYNFKAAGD